MTEMHVQSMDLSEGVPTTENVHRLYLCKVWVSDSCYFKV